MKEYDREALTKDRLREAMDRAEMKQADLVKATGLNKGTVSRYLSGEVEPRHEAIHKLARALDVSEMWLFGYKVPMQRTSDQKKNDDLVKVIAQLRTDEEFFGVVQLLAELPAEQYASLKNIISALGQK